MRERSERIRLLRDTDHDGIADRSTIYAEGFDDLLDGAAGGIFPWMIEYILPVSHISGP